MKRIPYISPQQEELDINLQSIICSSPDDGVSEDIDYEDWIMDSSDL